MRTIEHSYAHAFADEKISVWKKFMTWCTNQDENRYAWLAAGIFGHGCILAPITLLVTAITGVNMLFFALVIVSMAAVLVSNLAALPTKYTVPILFGSILVNLLVAVASLV
jgi:hypothetical protein